MTSSLRRVTLWMMLFPLCLPFDSYVNADPMAWSFKTDKPGELDVFGYYEGERLAVRWFSGEHPGGGARFTGIIGAGPMGKQPIKPQYRLTTEDPDPTLDVAFIVGRPGEFSMREIAEGLVATIGFNEFEVPMFGSPAIELFAGVNLAEWLMQPPPFREGDVFSFVNGVSLFLPGFIVGTSPIEFTPESGFFTRDPYTGEARVFATADGSAVIPEPTSLLLLGSGLVGLCTAARRRLRLSSRGDISHADTGASGLARDVHGALADPVPDRLP